MDPREKLTRKINEALKRNKLLIEKRRNQFLKEKVPYIFNGSANETRRSYVVTRAGKERRQKTKIPQGILSPVRWRIRWRRSFKKKIVIFFKKEKTTNKLILLNTSNKQKTFASFLYSINCLQMKMEVLSVQNQYPAHFALATGKFRKSSPFKKNFSSPT